jgi:hypothetical protein
MQIRVAFAGFLFFFSLASASLAQQVVSSGGRIESPSVAVAGTGDFMIVWNDLDDGIRSYGVYARLFEASGKPKGPAFLVHENRAGHQFKPKVAADERGNFVVVWQGGTSSQNGAAPGGDGDGLGVFAQRFDRTGRRVGPPIRANRSPNGDQASPNVAMEADGTFFVVWEDCSQLNRCPSLRVGRFSAAGERRGTELNIPVLAGAGGSLPMASIAVEPGGFAVGWTEYEACYKWYLERFPVVVHFTSSGRQVGEKFRLDDGDCEDATGWTLAALTASPAGTSAAFFNGQRNSFQLFTPDGDPTGPRKVIGKRNPCAGQRCEAIGAAAMDPEGRFAVIWSLRSTPDPDFPLSAQFFDRSGQPDGGRFEVASSSSPYVKPAAAFRKDGTLIVVWSDLLPDGSGSRLVFRQIRR